MSPGRRAAAMRRATEAQSVVDGGAGDDLEAGGPHELDVAREAGHQAVAEERLIDRHRPAQARGGGAEPQVPVLDDAEGLVEDVTGARRRRGERRESAEGL